MSINILVAPSGFKESLSPEEVADCIEEGILRALPSASVRKLPLVDGGEGFAKTLVNVTGGSLHTVTVTGPIGQPVEACYGLLGGSGIRTAVLEMASAAGLRLVPQGRRNPLYTTTYGVGELINAALNAGAERILIGCSDSGTNDGGAGMAQALGVRLLDQAGNSIGLGGAELARITRVDLSERDPRIDDVKIDVACNFHNVLCGPDGVSRVYGPQKGASPETVELLSHAFENYAAILKKEFGIDVRLMPGGGASGGLGAGLHCFLNATLNHRYAIIMRYLDIEGPLSNSDMVITAEGCIDSTTLRGKIPCEIARLAKERGVPTVVLAGTIGSDAELTLKHGVDSFASIVDSPMLLSEAIERAPQLVKQGAERVMRTILVGKELYENKDAEKYCSDGSVAEKSNQGTVANPLPHAFIGAMSEELRTPLNLIIGYSKMVKDGLLGTIGPEQEKALQQVIKNSYWLLMMMNGLLQSSGSPDRAAPMPIADALVSEVLPTPPAKHVVLS